MTKLIEFQTEEGSFWIETTENSDHSDTNFENTRTRVSGGNKERGLSSNLKGKFGDAVNTLKLVANGVVKKAREIADAPDEMEIKLGLKFSAEAGAIIAKTSTEGNLEVVMKWKKKESEA